MVKSPLGFDKQEGEALTAEAEKFSLDDIGIAMEEGSKQGDWKNRNENTFSKYCHSLSKILPSLNLSTIKPSNKDTSTSYKSHSTANSLTTHLLLAAEEDVPKTLSVWEASMYSSPFLRILMQRSARLSLYPWSRYLFTNNLYVPDMAGLNKPVQRCGREGLSS
jgi:hypothetical protein